MARRVAEMAAGKTWAAGVGVGDRRAFVPTRPEKQGAGGWPPAHEGKRAPWQGAWQEAKGFRFYLWIGSGSSSAELVSGGL